MTRVLWSEDRRREEGDKAVLIKIKRDRKRWNKRWSETAGTEIKER